MVFLLVNMRFSSINNNNGRQRECRSKGKGLKYLHASHYDVSLSNISLCIKSSHTFEFIAADLNIS